MFRTSMFGGLLKLLPREIVHKATREHASDRWCKSFKTWDHLVAMLAAQLTGRTSLRETELLLAAHPKHHYHLHCAAVKRSTLADANRSRDHAVFASITSALIARLGRRERGANAMLSILDSSPIRLDGRGHEWARESTTRHANQGLKVHLLLAPEEGWLDYASITDMNVNDITEAMNLPIKADRIYLFDKGYCDYNWWLEIIEAGSHFVTRIKTNAAWRTLEVRPVADDHILSDRTIELTNKSPRAGKTNRLAGHPLRLVEIRHPSRKGKTILILSDMMEATAAEIAALYKRRWDIELLFKWIKQNLKIKRFMGESRNAILIQVYVAIIAYLLLRIYRSMLCPTIALRLKDIADICKTSLFQPVYINPASTRSDGYHQTELNL